MGEVINIRKNLGFDSTDERSKWFYGDIFKTKTRRRKARIRYNKIAKYNKLRINRMKNEIKKLQKTIDSEAIGKHDIKSNNR